MNATTITKTRWFWPWQDDKEEGWLESMAQEGWHLSGLGLPCAYSFTAGEPKQFTYRLDYMPTNKSRWDEYMQLFRDAGWEYIGEMSNWRYWRKPTGTGEAQEIYSDTESKIRKYRRLMGYLGFFMFFLIFLGSRMYINRPWLETGHLTFVSSVYLAAMIVYAVLIGIYAYVMIKLWMRISQLRNKHL